MQDEEARAQAQPRRPNVDYHMLDVFNKYSSWGVVLGDLISDLNRALFF